MEDIQLDYKKLVDSRNQPIVNQILNGSITIDLVQKKPLLVPYWSMFFEKAKGIAHIYAGINKEDKNGFTHELLHVIEEMNGQFPHEVLPQLIGLSNSPFRFIFNEGNVTQINNLILHTRMFPSFINHRFKANKFLYDYFFIPRVNKKYVKKFPITFENKIRRDILPSFLCAYFCWRLHLNQHIRKFNQQNYLFYYSQVDDSLLSDLENLCARWENSQISTNENFFSELFCILDSWYSTYNYK